MKNVVRAAVVLGLVGALLYFNRERLFGKAPDNAIRLSGNMELTQVDIAFKVPGKLVALNVKEGSEVKKGMVIAQIDQQSTLRQKSREQAGLESANAQMAQMVTAVQFQRESLEGDLQVKRADLKNADAHLAELLAGSRPQEIQSARAQMEDAKTWFDQAKKDWERAQVLFKNEDISASQHDQFRSKYESTQQALRQAQQRLAMIEEGPRKETIDAARAQVERAKAAIRLAEANRIELKRKEQEIAVRRAEIDRAKAGISIIDSQIDDTTVASPIDGVVLVKSAELGEIVAAGANIVTIGDVTRPWLRAYIGEKDLGRVKLGASVKLTTDSFPGKVYMGKVTFIASEAEFTPKQIQTKDERVKLVYRIKIEVDNPNQELKSNMPVDGEILL